MTLSTKLDGSRKRILVFCDYYLPSMKSGGGMWTVVNLVDTFHDTYDFFVVTRNYDSKGDTKPYTSVKTGEWNDVGNAKVYYVARRDITRRTAAKLVNEISPDCIFLNSAFSTPAVRLLEARRSGAGPGIPLILAPCGELSAGSLAIKSLKKKLFLAYAKLTGMYKDVIWKASTEIEKEEIESVFGVEQEIYVAPDLVPPAILPDHSIGSKPVKRSGEVRLAFLSRIVRKKNIHYFLELLRGVTEGKVVFDIIGPIEDQNYWKRCLKPIEEMPPNVEVNVVGAVSYTEGLDLLCNTHFFVLPTLTENFGYVFLESMSAGTPLLISDQTVWGEVEDAGAGWIVPLSDKDRWSRLIVKCIDMGPDEYLAMSGAAREFAQTWLRETDLASATAKVLRRALGDNDKRAT